MSTPTKCFNVTKMDAVDERLDNFQRWCGSNGIVFPSIELRFCGPEAGFGIFSKKMLQRDQIVLQVPKKMMLTAELIAEMDDYSNIFKKFPQKLKPFEVLVLFFYLEKLKHDSFWLPYLELLPTKFGTPLSSLPNLNLGQLPSDVRTQIEKQRQEVDLMKSKLEEMVPQLDEKHLLWSWHIVNSRCIHNENPWHPLVDCSDGNNLAVIPLMDMMNHDPEAQCSPTFDKKCQQYKIMANKMLFPEDQLFVCYGPHNNANLWIEYGFTIEGNVFNTVKIPFNLILLLANKVGFKVGEKNESVAREAAFPCTLYASDEAISYGLRMTCIIFQMKMNELADWQKIVFNETDDDRREQAEQLGIQIVAELAKQFEQKLKNTEPSLKWIWGDQISVIQTIIGKST